MKADDPVDGELVEEETISYVEDHGIRQIPLLPPAPVDEQALGEPVPEVQVLWTEEGVREHLTMFGEGMHMLIGQGETDWKMVKQDLDRMAPPLTRIANQYEALARFAAVSDPLLLAYGTILYSYRSVLQTRDAKLAKQEAAERLQPQQGRWERVPDEDQEQDVAFYESQNGGRADRLLDPDRLERERRANEG